MCSQHLNAANPYAISSLALKSSRVIATPYHGGSVKQKLYRAKIVLDAGTIFATKNCTARYNFGCEKCTGLAKSIPGSENRPLAIYDVEYNAVTLIIDLLQVYVPYGAAL